MIEKVNPMHPDKIADRIAGAIVDWAYTQEENPKVAIDVLIGHGQCFIMGESSVFMDEEQIRKIVRRIAGPDINTEIFVAEQDVHLSENQVGEIKCGDNGIFKGVPLTSQEKLMSLLSRFIYMLHPYDGKYILNENQLVVCQSNTTTKTLEKELELVEYNKIINPLGDWTGGIDVDTGATNRKLGSDMAQSVSGGGLHGKDLSKPDVALNIYVFKKAQELGREVKLACAIGDKTVDGKPYSEIVNEARDFINEKGGFERFAEWGLF